jgi:hypothetical protein
LWQNDNLRLEFLRTKARFQMNSICQKFILMLMISAALISAPGRSIAMVVVYDFEAPSHSVEKFEFAEAGIARRNRRIRVESPSQLNSSGLVLEQRASSVGTRLTGRFALSATCAGHRLPNGLLAPLLI